MTQGLKQSQFIYNFGPGAILEGKNGPRIILTPQQGLFHPSSPYIQRIERYRIDDERMSKGLLNEGKIFRLPSNASEQLPQDEIIYHTNPFPIWKLCLNSDNHTPAEYVLYKGESCPSCHFFRGQHEAIRFVTACPAGHLDEIDWDYLTHRNQDGSKKTPCSRNQIRNIPAEMREDDCFIYYRGNGTISSIRIECPRCDRQPINFAQAFRGTLPCTGRLPEREQINGKEIRRYRSCARRMKIIQRQAASLRVPEIMTLLSIKSAATALQVMLREDNMKGSLVTLNTIGKLPKNKDEFRTILSGLVGGGNISQARMNEILRPSWDEIQEAIQKAIEPVPTLSYPDLINEEFQELLKGSGDEGIPPVSGKQPASEIFFEMDPNLRNWVAAPNGTTFRICPVSKLSTISVQVGYRREISDGQDPNTQPSLVSYETRLADGRGIVSTWYPGMRYLGEGLFIRLDKNDGWHPRLSGNHISQWQQTFESPDPQIYQDGLFRGKNQSNKVELHPVFVWWHTIAHLMVRTISEEAGYSSASIRERIFFEHNGNDARGGILLYATQPGSEGSLGGLISLAPYFEGIVESVFNQIQTCSGDPLCKDDEFNNKKYNGSACYGCLMNSETSCEHRNMWLDRHVVLDNIP